MKNKQIPFLYGISTVQLIGIIGLSVNTMAGTAVVAVGTVGILVYATANLFQRLKEKVCPECGTRIPKCDRICAVCGYRYREGIPEEKLTEFIEKEKEKEMSSEQIDCDFEKIETLAVEEMLSFDGDNENFLKRRGKEEEI